MTQTRQNLPKNAAKVEFIIHAETVKSMLRSGFNMRNIYNKLREEQNISMSYYTLCYYVRKIHEERQNKGLAEQQQQLIKPTTERQAAPITPQRQPGIIKTGSDPFPDPRNIDPKTLI